MPLPADDAVDVGDHAEGEARQPVGLETLAEGDAGYREIGGAGARRQIVAEPHVGDFGARLGFGERAGGGDPVGGEIEGDVVRDQRVEAGFLGRVGDGEAGGERELAVRETPVARQTGRASCREREWQYV